MSDTMYGLLSDSAELSCAAACGLRKLHAELILSMVAAKVFATESLGPDALGLEAIYAFTPSSSFSMYSTDISQSQTLKHKQQMLISWIELQDDIPDGVSQNSYRLATMYMMMMMMMMMVMMVMMVMMMMGVVMVM